MYPYTVCTAGLVRKGDHIKISHPDGGPLTVAQLAAIQGIPWQHEFDVKQCTITGVCKLIGNMYPPIVAEKHFRHIRKHLEKVDEGRGDV